MAHSPFRPHRVLVRLFAALLLVSCSGGSTCGGGSVFQPLPEGRFSGTKTDNVVNVRLSPAGVDYLNEDWQSLVELFAPGQTLTIPLACKQFELDVAGVGRAFIADQGSAGCRDTSCGRMDLKCDGRDVPANVQVQIRGFALEPRNGKLYVRLALSIATDTIFFDVDTVACDVGCSLLMDTGLSGNDTNTLEATVALRVVEKWDRRLSFQVEQVEGLSLCASEAQRQEGRCLDVDDVELVGQNFCGDVVCGLTEGFASFVQDYLASILNPFLQKMVKDLANKQACQACGTGKPPCPTGSTCQDGLCQDTTAGACVPRMLGVEGRVATGALLKGFGAPPEAALDVSVAAGSSVRLDQGIMLGTRAGLQRVEVARCVADIGPPPSPEVPEPDFDREAGAGSPYHVGLALSQPFLDMAMYHAQQSGTLCLGISGASVGALNTGMVKTFLPSLGKLATRDGLDAPMLVALRPGAAPSVKVGEGTYDPVTHKPVSPLLTLQLNSLGIDFYALIDERYVRLFSLTADVAMPLSLIFQDCSSVQPALGDLRNLVMNVRTANSEMLAEDPALLADLIPAVLGLAEPAIADLLKPMALPELAGYRLRVDQLKGITRVGDSDAFHHLGVFASLVPPDVACAVAAPYVTAWLKDSRVPSAGDMRLTGHGLPWPVAVLEVGAPGSTEAVEYAWRVGDGLWSTFAPAPHGVLEVSHPAFLLQGRHRIEVRARLASQPHGVSAPRGVDFTVDWTGPEVRLVPERESNRLRVEARDAVSAPEALSFAWRVEGGEWSDFGPARPVDLAAVEAAGGVQVRVKDASGNVGEARYRVPTVHRRPELAGSGAGTSGSGVGCQAGAGGGLGLALLALAGLQRRRRG